TCHLTSQPAAGHPARFVIASHDPKGIPRRRRPTQPHGGYCMAELNVRELIDSGIHFGHRVSRWNPKMKPYIYGKRNLIHIIDVKETIKGIIRARKFLTQM